MGAGRAALTAVSAVGAAGAAAAVWGIGIERYLFTVRSHELELLPTGSAPLRVLHISDVHMAPWQRRKQRWIASLARLRPDLIVNTGDNLGHAEGLRGLREAFAPFRGIPAVYVHGSNDEVGPSPRNPFLYFMGPSSRRHDAERLDTGALDAYLSDELGWRLIDNTATTLEVAGLPVTAFGVDDPHLRRDELGMLPDKLAGLERGSLTLGVAHAPYVRVLDAFTELGADLILAGHTHGGQVRIPGSPRALVANCDIPLDKARGLSRWRRDGRDVPLNVSAGLGHSIYAPVRFGCRPEATLITLLPRR